MPYKLGESAFKDWPSSSNLLPLSAYVQGNHDDAVTFKAKKIEAKVNISPELLEDARPLSFKGFKELMVVPKKQDLPPELACGEIGKLSGIGVVSPTLIDAFMRRGSRFKRQLVVEMPGRELTRAEKLFYRRFAEGMAKAEEEAILMGDKHVSEGRRMRAAVAPSGRVVLPQILSPKQLEGMGYLPQVRIECDPDEVGLENQNRDR